VRAVVKAAAIEWVLKGWLGTNSTSNATMATEITNATSTRFSFARAFEMRIETPNV
jgi:hypothetical protein